MSTAMWCIHCEQNVPGIASLEGGEEVVCCARCGEAISAASSPDGSPEESAGDPPPRLHEHRIAPPAWDEWELDETLYDVDRLLSEIGSPGSPAAAAWPPDGQPLASEPRLAAAAGKRSAPQRPRARSSWLAWLVLSLGVMTFVCGSVLLGWSFFTDRSMLWRIGLPLSLLGQAGLLIGLILQLEGLWQNDHEATETLGDLDEQITELRHAAAMLNASHSRPSQSFYLHMAEGASPHMMLADLKSQLDLLAVQLEKHRR